MSRSNATFGRIQAPIKMDRTCYACLRKFERGRKMLFSERHLTFHPKGTHLCVTCNQLIHQFPHKIGLDEKDIFSGYVKKAVDRFFCKDPEELTDLFVESAGVFFEEVF